MRGAPLVFAFAGIEVLALMPLAGFPGLVPVFIDAWGLSNTEAGWIGGIFFLGYMLVVPFLMALTDLFDARRVLVWGCAVSAAASFGYALLAAGFWSALFFRALSGAGLAAVYMPGLRALTDRIVAANQSRAVTFYTASYSVGVSLSFLIAGAVNDLAGWSLAFVAGGLGPLAALALVLALLEPVAPVSRGQLRALLDYRPVLRNREAMGYVLAYAAHGFELLAMRGWIVAFLLFAADRAGDSPTLGVTAIAALLTFIGLPASVLGNELALRFGRRRVVTGIMCVSAATACLVGLSAGQPFCLVLTLVLIYGATVTADSGSITAGAVAAAEPEQRGATMAVHSTLGFGASFLGPLTVGIALDVVGGDGGLAWFAAFAVMGLGVLTGPLALFILRRR
jgi:MFS family permease